MGSMDGPVALITGAARGMGRSHAIRLAEEGADIIAVDICPQIESVTVKMSSYDDLEETAARVRQTGRRVVCGVADVRDRPGLRAVVAEGVTALGRLDTMVANAGIWPSASINRPTTTSYQGSLADKVDGGVARSVLASTVRRVQSAGHAPAGAAAAARYRPSRRRSQQARDVSPCAATGRWHRGRPEQTPGARVVQPRGHTQPARLGYLVEVYVAHVSVSFAHRGCAVIMRPGCKSSCS